MTILEANPSFTQAILVVFSSPMHIGEAFSSMRANTDFRPSYEEFIECVEALRLARQLVALPADQNRLVAATWPSVPVEPREAIYASALSPLAACMMIAYLAAQAGSKDPNTKVGALVYDPQTKASYIGYNGFPPGYPDLRRIWDCRDAAAPQNKYKLVSHAEKNAVQKAMQAGAVLSRCILVVTHHPCHRCMVDFIASTGIREVYYADAYPPDKEADDVARIMNVKCVHAPELLTEALAFVAQLVESKKTT